jgi:hypothetical protein
MRRKTRLTLIAVFALALCVGAIVTDSAITVQPHWRQSRQGSGWVLQDEPYVQPHPQGESGVQDELQEGDDALDETYENYVMTDEEAERFIEHNNAKAEWNPAVLKILREGDAESFPYENVKNVERLGSLSAECIDRSLLYIGAFLTERNYDIPAIRIVVSDRVDDASTGSRHEKVFYFQVEGEPERYRACVTENERNPPWPVSVQELIGHIEGIENLTSLPQEYVERSLWYIGPQLAVDGYDVHTVEIEILDRIDDNPKRSYSKIFYFRVKSDGAYYSVHVSDREHEEFVSIQRRGRASIEGVG